MRTWVCFSLRCCDNWRPTMTRTTSSRPRAKARVMQIASKVLVAVTIMPSWSQNTTHLPWTWRRQRRPYWGVRDLRESASIAFGRWITSFEWDCALGLYHAKNKFETFYNILISAVDGFLPMKKIRKCSSNKLWVNQKLMALILERKKALFTCGKDSAKYKQLRNRVQHECKVC